MSQQGGMAARMVKCYNRNNNKLLLNTCKLEMKTKKQPHLVFIHLRTPFQLSKWSRLAHQTCIKKIDFVVKSPHPNK